MKTENIEYLSADGRTMIHAVKWLPDQGEFTAILQITHGMIEYIERYASFAEFLTSRGFLVVGHDHLGHGQSVQTKEDWGYIGEPNPSDLMVADMHTLRTTIQKQYPDLPYFMMGHSMGSYMLRKYLVFYNDNISGAVIMGTGMVPASTCKLGIRIAKLLALFKGWKYRSAFVANNSFGKPYKRFDLSGKDVSNSWLTKDEDIVKSYYSDERCTFMFSLNAYKALFETVMFDGDPENAKKLPCTLPLFIVSGQDDPVGDMGVGVKKVYDMYKEAGIEDITYQLYENDRHEILNELDREKIYFDIYSWMNVRK